MPRSIRTDGPESSTIARCLEAATRRLAAENVDSARLDAALILAYHLGCPREMLLMEGDKQLENNVIISFGALIERRARHEPVAYITGIKEFWSLDFTVTCDTLIPRPDSETLVNAALACIAAQGHSAPTAPVALLDIGTGSGCLLIALLHECTQAQGTGIDNNEGALNVAKTNAERLGVAARAHFLKSHWCDDVHESYDVIIANPPYIPESYHEALMPDVLHYEPRGALFAGMDGLDAYRALMPQIKSRLKSGGHVLFEIGQGQASAVTQLLAQHDLTLSHVAADLSGIPRTLVARHAAASF